MKSTGPSLTFIVPGLIDPVPSLAQLPVNDLPELPFFSKLLSRGNFSAAEIVPERPDNFYHCIVEELAPPDDRLLTSQPSIAALSYAFESSSTTASNEQWIMRADPSFLLADRDQLVMAQSGSMDLSLAEAQALAAEVNQFFAGYAEENFWQLKVVTAERWYIVSEKPINITAVPPENVLGQSVKGFLFSTDNEDGRHWMNLFNEIQMVLHQSDINKKRQSEKKVPVNSLWFWGAGQQFEISDKAHNKVSGSVYSDDFIVQNIAQLYAMKNSSLPEQFDFETYLSDSNHQSEHLFFIMDDFSRALRNKDIFSWVGLLQQFETNYLQSIISAVNKGKLKQLEIVSPSGKRLLLTKKLLRRWWKKQQPYQAFY